MMLGRPQSLAADVYAGREETEMFHGTDSHAAQLIVRGQRFRPSATGMLGAGVYVTRSRRKAEGYRTDLYRNTPESLDSRVLGEEYMRTASVSGTPSFSEATLELVLFVHFLGSLVPWFLG